jgi:DNA-binding beta-propeller fold protein YncE
VQTITISGGSGAGSLGVSALGLDPTGSTLYATDARANQISVLAIAIGTMTEIASSPVAVPVGTAPGGLDFAQA